jgi:hypothetical protein
VVGNDGRGVKFWRRVLLDTNTRMFRNAILVAHGIREFFQ